MRQLVNVLGCKATRTATRIIPCPVCHKRREARRSWYYVNYTKVVVCSSCYGITTDEEVFHACNKQGWVTICHNCCQYDYDTKFLIGVSL